MMMQIDNFKVEGSFPLVIKPKNPHVEFDEFTGHLREHKSQFQQLLLKHGAILLRGFPVASANNFEYVIESLDLGQLINYIGGNSPRTKVTEKVYTSTEAPPKAIIPLHQELSYIKNFPRHICFYCEVAAPNGGATIIGDARRIYEDISPAVKQRFQRKKLTYTSRYHYNSKFMNLLNRFERANKSWVEVFETHDKSEVEKRCAANGYTWRWLPQDWIEIQQTCPAVVTHPETNEEVWFNQAHHYDFNPRLIGWKYFLAAKLLCLDKAVFLHHILFADGSPVPRQDLYHIMDVLDKRTIAFPWHSSDVMILDNVLAMHGRAPFTGKRRVLTALTM